MIQRTYDPESEEQFAWMISSLKDPTLYAENRAVFIQLFFSRFNESEASRILSFIRSELPRAKIAGMSLYGDPIVNLNTNKFIRLNICEFEESDVKIFEYDAASRSVDEIASEFKENLCAVENGKGVLVLSSGLTFNISRFMEEVSDGNEAIPFFGAVSNINTADSKSVNPYVFSSRTIENGVVAVVFYGKNLHFFTDYTFGWNPIGRHFSVETGTSTVIGDTLVTKIDGKAATEIYKIYLNVDPDRHFVSNICEFPLVVERNGFIQARIPCGFNEKGELNVMGDIKNGEKIRFSYGKTDDILRKSYNSASKMAEFLPQGIFLYVCANRAIFMKERANEEIANYRKIAPNLMYCHGFSELYRFEGRGGVFNSTLISVGLREGDREAMSDTWRTVLPKGLVSFNVENASNNEKKDFESIGFDSFSNNVLSDNVHSLFERPFGKSIPLADRLVTFLEATTADFARASEAAKAASNAKSAFLSNMSHEIRTPINAVLGLDEMILRESSEPHIKKYAQDIQSAGRALLSIVNDILDFSKIEAGKMEIINAPYDLRRVINDLTNMVASRAESKGLEFIVDIDETIPHLLFGDAVRIQQCALNILTNAVKYTRKGRVMLSVGAERGKTPDEIELCFSVHDTGIGIKKEDLAKLASPFERIEESRNRSIEGTGLGMSIVYGLLRKMGSELVVQSEYGEGSSFSFAVKQKVRSMEAIGTYAEARKALAEENSSYTESFQAPNAKILVIDDTAMNIAVFRGLLKTTRCKIDSAESADEGLKLTRENKYDILFVDHLMPKKDGIAFLKELRSDKGNENREAVCIALTANAVTGAKEMYISAGFDGYLTKPIDSALLESTIAEKLSKEKVLHKGDKGYLEDNSKKEVSFVSETPLTSLFNELFCLDFATALKNCGSLETFKSTLCVFYKSIEEKSLEIESALAENDWDMFTIKVHALKSSARLIGAIELSEEAKFLEAASNTLRSQCPLSAETVSSGSIDEIKREGKNLLAHYRSYAELLSQFFKNEEKSEKKNDSEKSLLGEREFFEGLEAIKVAVDGSDFDGAEAIMSEMDNYLLPAVYREQYAELRRSVQNIDAGKSIYCINTLLKRKL